MKLCNRQEDKESKRKEVHAKTKNHASIKAIKGLIINSMIN